jgi:hypothetical protein
METHQTPTNTSWISALSDNPFEAVPGYDRSLGQDAPDTVKEASQYTPHNDRLFGVGNV